MNNPTDELRQVILTLRPLFLKRYPELCEARKKDKAGIEVTEEEECLLILFGTGEPQPMGLIQTKGLEVGP